MNFLRRVGKWFDDWGTHLLLGTLCVTVVGLLAGALYENVTLRTRSTCVVEHLVRDECVMFIDVSGDGSASVPFFYECSGTVCDVEVQECRDSWWDPWVLCGQD